MKNALTAEKFNFCREIIKSKIQSILQKDFFQFKKSRENSIFLSLPLLVFLCFHALPNAYSQTVNQFNQTQVYGNYLSNSSAFRQEIARLEIYVTRPGEKSLPITEVPRLFKNDVLRVRLSDEPVNGMKIDQSNYDWTLLVAYLNPGRNSDPENTVSEEIQFKKSGWYKEYSFVVPYDSQPVFFLYPKPNYRNKILNLVSNNQHELRKLGEKTIEIAGAYAKIGSFLNELQSVIYRNQYYNGYGGYGGYGYQNNFNSGKNFFMEQAVERLARSFNIQLPPCWTEFTAITIILIIITILITITTTIIITLTEVTELTEPATILRAEFNASPEMCASRIWI